jgi:hypothetical protein
MAWFCWFQGHRDPDSFLEGDRGHAQEFVLAERRAVGSDRAAFANRFAVSSGLMIAGSSAGLCMFSRAAAAGVIARPNTVRRQRSITASCAGRVGGCGRTCSGSWLGVDDRPRAVLRKMREPSVSFHRSQLLPPTALSLAERPED